MFSSSKTWVSPRFRENTNRQQLNFFRKKVCPKSPFWSLDFDLAYHKKEWEAGRERKYEQKMAHEMAIEEEKQKMQDSGFITTPSNIRAPFNGEDFKTKTNHSAVLSYETVFCPQWQQGKENIALWPGKSEMKYEGDDRISTDRLHGRFPGAPRVPGNETVNWQHRAVVDQYPFDDFYYPIPNAAEILMRTHWVEELEFSDEEGEKAIGKDLVDMLDPQDQ